jgi:hypothetical protein
MDCDEGECEHEWHYDSPRTFRGTMQRGLGHAAHGARVDPAGEQIAMECLRRDYRWDWQVDDRYVYLARLARDLNLDITLLGDQMRACGPRKHFGERDPADDDNQFAVAVGVLECLARTGNENARRMLREYVVDGVRWLEVLEQISDSWPLAWWDDLWEVAARRLQHTDSNELLFDSVPWPGWRGRDPHIDAVVGAARARVELARTARGSPDLEPMTTCELIAVLGSSTADRPAKVSVLAQLRRREPAPELLDLVASTKDPSLPLLGRELRRLGPQAIAAARSWAASPGYPLAWTGQLILAEHGDDSDIPALLAAIEHLDAVGGWCGYDAITAGLARILTAADAEPVAKNQLVRRLRRLLKASPHSYERASYLDSLRLLDPVGIAGVLPIFLLDCEPGVRLLASKHTPLTDDARRWLTEISKDPLEEDDIRKAATERIHRTETM